MSKKTREKSVENRQALKEAEAKGKKEALRVVMEQAEKKHGKGAITILGNIPIEKIPVIRTGVTSLDVATGVGGMPRGRIIEVFGPEAGGKTTLCLQVIAEAQKAGGKALFVDAEHALDLALARGVGVDVNSLILHQPDSGEQALDIVEMFANSHAIDIIVVDSVAALTPRSEIQGEMGEATMGAQARLMGQAMRKLTHAVGNSSTVLMFINQLRQKIGILYGNPEFTPGGNALKFYASMRLDTRRVEAIKQGTVVIGSKTRIRVVKNKVAPPFRETIVDIIFGKGVSKEGDLLECALQLEVVQKSGNQYSYKDTSLGQGKDEVLRFLEVDPVFCEELRTQVFAKVAEQFSASQ